MPANLGPEYKAAEELFRQALTPEEQLEALQQMLRAIPKHKGTEKMQADLKRRISRARKDAREARKKGGAQKPYFHVERGGAGQVALIGPPNSGKSQLLAALTNAHPDVADYPFTTQLPGPGMMQYEDIQIQLVDLPAIARDVTEGWVLGLARNADVVLVVLDAASDDVLEETEELFELLSEKSIELVPPSAEQIPVGEGLGTTKRAIIAATKMDKPSSVANLELLRELIANRLPVEAVSSETGEGLDRLRSELFAALHVIRVYTKAPGKPPEQPAPYILRQGSTLLDAARAVHADFQDNLRFARIWGEDRYDGQMVGRDDILSDKDLIELHA